LEKCLFLTTMGTSIKTSIASNWCTQQGKIAWVICESMQLSKVSNIQVQTSVSVNKIVAHMTIIEIPYIFNACGS
jgi:hypothetical protein